MLALNASILIEYALNPGNEQWQCLCRLESEKSFVHINDEETTPRPWIF